MSLRSLVSGPVARIITVSLGSNVVDGIRVAAFAVLAMGYADSALDVAIVATVATLPEVFLSMPIGVLLDRWDKVRTLYLSNLSRAFLLIGLAIALSLGAGSILLLCGFALVFGILEEVYDSVSVLVVPDLTEPNEYLKSNAAIRWVQELGNGTIGPFLGAVLVGWSVTTPFALSACILLIASFVLRSLNRSHLLVHDQTAGEKREAEGDESNNDDEGAAVPTVKLNGAAFAHHLIAFFKELWAGVVVAWRNPFARNIVAVYGLWNIFGWMPEAILIVYVNEALGGDASVYGLLLAITSIGALMGGLALFVVPDEVSVRGVAAFALGIYALTIAVPGIWPNFWVAAAAFFIQGLPLVLLNGTVAAQMQLTIERGFLARVYSVIGTVGSLCMTLGLFLGGVIADFASTPFVFVLGGAGVGAAAVVAALTFSAKVAPIKEE